MKYHDAANIFPMMGQVELDALAADISKNGLQVPIEVFEDQIVDGRNRWLACNIAGIDPDVVDVTDDVEDPVAYVLSLNLHRRHLDETQRAMVGARVKKRYELEAKERVTGRPSLTKVPENFPELNQGDARDKAGESVGVTGRSVSSAEKVISKGSKQLQDLCDKGAVSVSAASKLAELPKSKQNEILSTGGNIKKVVSDAAKNVNRLKQQDEDWETSELNRKKQVESGKTVVANKKNDHRLIAWAEKKGLAVEIGRGSIWGNPFVLNDDGTRDEVCINYWAYYKLKPSLQRKINLLKGKVLVCWCHPERCHGDELRRLAK